MTNTLKLFTTSSLFDATSALLAKLNIRFNRQTAEPINVAALYDGAMPQYLTNALRLIEHTYFIGVANDLSLYTGEKSDNTIDEISEKIANGGRYDGMFIFACDAMADAHITRSDISALTRAFNRISYANPVILIIRQANLISLSTCERMTYTQEWRKNFGEKLGKVSILRNVDCLNPHRGHIDIIKELVCSDCNTFDELYVKWNKLFNSEVLTKKFYKELFEWYQWAIDPATNVTFPGNADTPDDDREDIDTRVIRLITRLMFVWFIKQKNLVPKDIFEVEYLKRILKNFDPFSTTQSNYYQGILQNLFFATLNRPILEDGETRAFATSGGKEVTNLYRYGSTDDDGGLFNITDKEVIDIFSTVPFLNCGLFECLDKTRMMDGVERRYYNDGFSRNIQKFKNGTYRYRAVVPNILFFHEEKGIISIFKRNIFTIEENTPQDIQVALDPELLGKVFENLLGAYNPETRETVRKQTGSYYTPREIVQYMVNESLVAHLKNAVGDNLESEYRKLLSFNDEEIFLTNEQKSEIVHSIFTCKVLDPACGSGAFPMGMLQQMVHILQKIDPDNRQWRNQLENFAADDSRKAFGITDEEERNAKLDDIRETFNNALNSPDYTRKLYIIESCIYGSDIQPIAILITRLRFFITLVCEQDDIKWDKPEENFGIKTLPNLESKFVAANTLLDADIHKYGQTIKYDEQLTKTKDELLAVRHKHFYTHKRSKKIKLLKQDELIRAKLLTLINAEVAKPDGHRIFELEQRIAECENELPKYEMSLMAEEAVQTDIFGNTNKILVDKNKEKRESLNIIIKKCKSEIEKEKNKKIPPGFENAVLQVTDWNPYDQNKVAPFLDFEWMFGLTEGFDIIIGNPPYIKEGKMSKVFFEPYKNSPYYKGKMDIWYIFACRGIDFLNANGILCFIATNNWVTSFGASKLRNKVIKETRICNIVDFGAVMMFESASIQTMIMMFQKDNVTDDYIFDYRKLTLFNATEKDAAAMLNKTAINAEYFSPTIRRANFIDKNITFSNNAKVFDDIEHSKNLIYLFDNEIAQGIVFPQDTLNKKNQQILGEDFYVGQGIFVLTNDEKRALNLNQNELTLLKPYYMSENIKRFVSFPSNNLWTIYTNSSYKDSNSLDAFPNIKRHLDRFLPIFTSDNKPYGLHRARENRFFCKDKIIALRKCVERPLFSFCDFNCYLSQSFNMIQTVRVDLKYLTGLLNSKLIEFWLKNKGKMQGANYQLDKEPLMQIPIAVPSKDVQLLMAKVVDIIIMLKRSKECACELVTNDYLSAEFEHLINGCVYEIYLSNEMSSVGISVISVLKECFLQMPNMTINDVWPLYSRIDSTGIIEKIKTLSFSESESLRIIALS